MNAYIESVYSDDLEFEIYFRESALEAKKMQFDYMQLEMMYETGNEEAKSGIFAKMLESIREFFARLKQTISNFMTAISQSFGREVTVQDYIDSDAADVRIKGDVEKITKEIQDEILSERKGVQAISKAVKSISEKANLPLDKFFDDRAIANTIDKVNGFVIDNGEAAVSAAVATAIANKLSKSIKDTSGITEDLEKCRKELNAKRKGIHDAKMEMYNVRGKKLAGVIENLGYAVGKTSSRAMRYYAAVTKPINKFKMQYRKNVVQKNKEK